MTINGLIVPDHINYMSIHAAASVLAPGLTPGSLSMLSIAPAANPQRLLVAGVEPAHGEAFCPAALTGAAAARIPIETYTNTEAGRT